jgi:hypothetical protein
LISVKRIYHFEILFSNQNIGFQNFKPAEIIFFSTLLKSTRKKPRVSVQGVKSLGGHFACLCREFDFYEVKKEIFYYYFSKEKGNTFTLLIIFIVKNLQNEQNSTNLLL